MTERLQMPTAGGSYMRLEDGTLQLIEGPTQATESPMEAEPAAPPPPPPAPEADSPAAVALPETGDEEHI